jgi:spermidine synthase
MAGIEAAIGDYVVIADPVFDPLDAIFAVVKKNKKADVVQGIADIKSKRALSGNFLRRAFYWYNRHYLNIDGLRRAGYKDHANALTETTLEMVKRSGFAEYFDPVTGEPLGAHNFSWTAALVLDLLKQKS